MQLKEQIIAYIDKNGPSHINALCKYFNLDRSFMIAYIEELLAQNVILKTHFKLSQEHFYYISEKKEKLLDLEKYLNNEEKEAIKLLMQRKVVFEDKLKEDTKKIIQNLKDFALQFKLKQDNRIFYKWYLIEEEEAIEFINLELDLEETMPRNIEIKSNSELNKYLIDKKIEVISEVEIIKDQEYDLVVYIQTSIGKLKYYLKYKKILEEINIKNAIENSKSLNLPLIILTSKEFDDKIIIEYPEIVIKKIKD